MDVREQKLGVCIRVPSDVPGDTSFAVSDCRPDFNAGGCPEANIWAHVAVVYNSTGCPRLFRDGVEAAGRECINHVTVCSFRKQRPPCASM